MNELNTPLELSTTGKAILRYGVEIAASREAYAMVIDERPGGHDGLLFAGVIDGKPARIVPMKLADLLDQARNESFEIPGEVLSRLMLDWNEAQEQMRIGLVPYFIINTEGEITMHYCTN